MKGTLFSYISFWSRFSLRFWFLAWTAAVLFTGCATHPSRERNPIAQELEAAEAAQARAERPGLSPSQHTRSVAAYNKATASVVEILKDRTSITTWSALTNQGLVVGKYLLRVHPEMACDPKMAFHQFDRFYPANPDEETGAVRSCVRQGFGAPLVGEQSAAPYLAHERTNFFSRRIYLPVTALLDFPRSSNSVFRPVELTLADPRFQTNTPIRGTNQPIAANFAAPARRSLAHDTFLKAAWLGLLWPGLHLETTGLFLMEPYDPEKIPVVLVHGLYSSPATWLELSSALSADPELSARFQIWYFIYPTGLPIPGSAKRLRESLSTVLNHLDPGLSHPTSRQMVLIGHSMGGLLSQLQTTDSGDAFWQSYFSKPISDLILSESARSSLKNSFYFERQPFVSRLIFIATPHRGSELADTWFSRLFVRLIQLPATTIKTTTEVLTLNVDAVRPDLLKYRSLASTSLESLSPGNPLFKALEAQPIHVPCHSIIANRARDVSKPTSDGVVPYWSSHLTNSASEVVITAGHACTDNAMAIAEVKRILRLHLAELRPSPAVASDSHLLSTESVK